MGEEKLYMNYIRKSEWVMRSIFSLLNTSEIEIGFHSALRGKKKKKKKGV